MKRFGGVARAVPPWPRSHDSIHQENGSFKPALSQTTNRRNCSLCAAANYVPLHSHRFDLAESLGLFSRHTREPSRERVWDCSLSTTGYFPVMMLSKRWCAFPHDQMRTVIIRRGRCNEAEIAKFLGYLMRGRRQPCRDSQWHADQKTCRDRESANRIVNGIGNHDPVTLSGKTILV